MSNLSNTSKIPQNLEKKINECESFRKLDHVLTGKILFRPGTNYKNTLKGYEKHYVGFVTHVGGIKTEYECPVRYIRALAKQKEVLKMIYDG